MVRVPFLRRSSASTRDRKGWNWGPVCVRRPSWAGLRSRKGSSAWPACRFRWLPRATCGPRHRGGGQPTSARVDGGSGRGGDADDACSFPCPSAKAVAKPRSKAVSIAWPALSSISKSRGSLSLASTRLRAFSEAGRLLQRQECLQSPSWRKNSVHSRKKAKCLDRHLAAIRRPSQRPRCRPPWPALPPGPRAARRGQRCRSRAVAASWGRPERDPRRSPGRATDRGQDASPTVHPGRRDRRQSIS